MTNNQELRIIRTVPGPGTGDQQVVTEDGRTWEKRQDYQYNTENQTGVTRGRISEDKRHIRHD